MSPYVFRCPNCKIVYEYCERHCLQCGDVQGCEKVHWLHYLADRVHAANLAWWLDPVTGARIERNKGELIALMHSELSEMLEGVRKGLKDDHLPNRLMEEVELADLIIRALDYVGGFRLDIGSAFEEKMVYNQHRADHKAEARQATGGKKF